MWAFGRKWGTSSASHKHTHTLLIQHFSCPACPRPPHTLNGPDKHGPCWRWQINEAPLLGSFVLVIRLSQWRVQNWVPGSCTQNTYEQSCPEGQGWRSPHQQRFTSACEPRRLGLNRMSGTVPACTGWHSVALCFFKTEVEPLFGEISYWLYRLCSFCMCSFCIFFNFKMNPFMHELLIWYKIYDMPKMIEIIQEQGHLLPKFCSSCVQLKIIE